MLFEEELKILDNDLVLIAYNIQEYRKLFMDDENNYLLSKSAPNFFENYKRLFWNNLLLSIRRLTDNHKQRNNKTNLTIDIIYIYAERNNLSCYEEIKKEIDIIRNNSKIPRIWGDKILAHRDLNYALKENYNDIKIHLDEIEIIVKSVHSCLDKIYLEIKDANVEWTVSVSYGAEALMYYLKEGFVYLNIKKQRDDWKLDKNELDNFMNNNFK